MNTTKMSPEEKSRTIAAGRLKAPRNREELWRWVKNILGMKLPERPLCLHHQTPLDYLEYVFFERTEIPDVVVWACRGGGKTMVGAIATLLDMLFKPGTQIRILGGSEEQSAKMYTYLRGLVEEHFEDQLRGRIGRKGFSFKNGSRVEILAQSHTAVRGTRVQKMRCDEVELFDPEVWEAAQLTTQTLTKPTPSAGWGQNASAGKSAPAPIHDATVSASEISNLKSQIPTSPTNSMTQSPQSMTQSLNDSISQSVNPSITQSRGAVEVYSTMHKVGGLMTDLLDPANRGARKVFAWCLWDVIERCHPKRKCEGCVLWDECRGRARGAGGFIRVADAIAMKRRTSARTWETEMLCFRPFTEDQVFDAFDRSVHIRALDLPAVGARVDGPGGGELRMESVIAGIDFGWRQFACVWLGMLRNAAGERVVWIFDEYVEARRPLELHALALKSRHIDGTPLRAAVAYCDVAGRQHDAHTGRTSVEQLRAGGFRVSCRAMHIEDGIGMINALLPPRPGGDVPGAGGARFFVHPRCEKLAAALESYRRDRKGKPIKDGEHDHIIDALRYAVVGHDGRGGGKVDTRAY